MSSVVLKLDNVTKRFGDVIAVDKISFEVMRGELFSLLGPSGCGKTTTLRIIAGLEFPDEGRVYINNIDVTNKPAKERSVCLVFQEYAVFPHMSVYENIAFGLRVRNYSKSDIDRIVREVAELLNINDILNQRASKLSLSAQQRVAVARCLVVKPAILLLDEPLTMVDARVKETLRRELRKMQKDLGITTIFVTHDQLEAFMISDKIAVMNKGRILQIGTPQEIYNKPINTFVATFVGSPTVNLVEGHIEIMNERPVFRSNDKSLIIYLREPRSKETLMSLVNKPVIIGVRPEDIEISAEGHIKGYVSMLEFLGDKIVLKIKISENISLRLFTDLYSKISLGGEVLLKINSDNLNIFDPATGVRIEW